MINKTYIIIDDIFFLKKYTCIQVLNSELKRQYAKDNNCVTKNKIISRLVAIIILYYIYCEHVLTVGNKILNAKQCIAIFSI